MDLLTIAVLVAAVTTAVCVLVRFSAFGLRLAAIRENADAAVGLGISVTRHRLGALVLSGALTGAAGGVFALQQIHLEPVGTLGISWTIDAVLVTVIGGLGPIIGATLVELLLTRQLVAQPVIGLVVEGLVLIAVVLLAPRGLWPTAAALCRRVVQRRPARDAAAPGAADPEEPPPAESVAAEHLRHG